MRQHTRGTLLRSPNSALPDPFSTQQAGPLRTRTTGRAEAQRHRKFETTILGCSGQESLKPETVRTQSPAAPRCLDSHQGKGVFLPDTTLHVHSTNTLPPTLTQSQDDEGEGEERNDEERESTSTRV